MIKLKITTNKMFTMDSIDSITLSQNLNGRQIDYRYSDPTDIDPKYNYFELEINGVTKILAVAGKVEEWDTPNTEQKTREWEKL